MALSLFEQYLFEAPEDTPPDVAASDNNPPDMPADAATTEDPPDIPPDVPEDQPVEEDGPPDIGDNFGEDDFTNEDPSSEEEPSTDQQPLELDEKISSIMNKNLYKRSLTLLNTINNQLTQIKGNNDVLYTLSSSSVNIVEVLKKLEENLRIYLNENFINENYSKNLLFFNKCLNLLKLLNDAFDKSIKKGIKALE